MVFDKYEVIKEISTDVLSVTYCANQISKNEKVFLRVYKSENISDLLIPQCESFLKKLTGIAHLAIVKTIEWFWQEKDLIIVEEFFEGETLENIFSKPSNLEINKVYKISQEILNLLAEAHKINLYHGGLSPREIILTDQGLKIRGWGIASILGRNTSAKTSSLVADAHYLAPEEIRGENGTEKIDIYLFGLILYQMCTGVFPFIGKTNVSVALRHLHDEPNKPTYLNPALPLTLEKIISQCLQKDPQARPSAQNVLDSFKQISTNSSPPIFPELVSPSKNEDIFSLKENSAVVLEKKSAFTKGIVFLCVLFIGWYIYNSSFFIRGETVVPTLYGMPLEKAVKLLAEKDLGSEIVGSIKSKELPVGAVVSQEPSGGRFVRAGRKIRLILSGESMVIVPDLIGESVAQAKEILKKYGLKPADQKLIEEKIIVGQNPAPGFEIPLNAKVSMETGYEFVSLKVPSFLQKTIFDAEEIADKESLEIGKVVYQKSTAQEKDFVIDQNPLPQENMPRGAKIDLVIGQGEEGEDHQLKRAVVEFTVPSQTSSKEYNLKIDVVDDLGEFSVFENLFRPSETVKYSVLGVGAAKVRIFLDGVLEKETSF